ncbi:hypothetical protein [Shinella sp. M31]|uniref:hypothetical protein n=1 Tax=Shinella sp. M31 TaxID=3368615 RepID=UPI003B9E51C7
MSDQLEATSKAPLSPGDLEMLEKILAAWCEENGAARSSIEAQNIAAALISWYEQDANSRSLVPLENTDAEPLSPEIELLLRQFT